MYLQKYLSRKWYNFQDNALLLQKLKKYYISFSQLTIADTTMNARFSPLRHGFLSLLTAMSALNLSAQMPIVPIAKREMRGVWVATVVNIDYPATRTTDSKFLQSEWMRLLDSYKALNINAVFVQIRPSGDALYKSDIVPWSKYLTGSQGTPPSDGYDPLEFMVRTAHEKNIEFHAWMNPYRAAMDNETAAGMHPLHMMKQHPEWFVKYNKRTLFNPGLPEVRTHINDVVSEIVQKYDIDAIHFDDYFYPYKNGNEQFIDGAAYSKYNYNGLSLEDWRRENVDQLISMLSATIKRIKPRVQFGISPFGVWRNSYKDPSGSSTYAGVTCYDDLYADVKKWLQMGWIDYVVPQVYWSLGFNTAEHAACTQWWAANSYGKAVYIGLGAYRVGVSNAKEPKWKDPNQIAQQIDFDRSVSGVKGFVLFSSKNLVQNPLGFASALRANQFAEYAAPPVLFRDTSALACDLAEIRTLTAENGKVSVRWKPTSKSREYYFQYLVYRFDKGKADYNDGKNIIAFLPGDTKDLTFNDLDVANGRNYTYSVVANDCEKTVETLNMASIAAQVAEHATKKQSEQDAVLYPKKKKKSFWKRVFGG
jgi:uncharacterized lipoprotein YddW (UPF0748 family)